ncbi:MAG: hypothetical protein IT204_08525 [Fimbriimonadaceae bacterium]|nr:hypothetical protein [Fimbriimonadaceae bacterium]
MTPRERVRLALAHQYADRIPIALVCSGIHAPVAAGMAAILQQERGLSLAQYLAPLLDIKNVAPPYVGPERPPQTDYWGVRRAPISFGDGAYDEICHYPLAAVRSVAELADYPWPTTAWFDYEALATQIAELDRETEYCLLAANGNIFESSWYLRGFEQTLTDLALQPELPLAIFERVTAFFCEHFDRLLTAARGRIDLVFTADDIGGQEGLLMSLGMWRDHLMPFHARLNQVIHAHGARVIYHSDGCVTPAVPGLLEMGIDILQALQFDCRDMDPLHLKATYGDRLCFQGGVSVQQTLPFGTVAEVIAETRARIEVLGRDGGYVLGPSHAIQIGTPPANVLAMFDTAASYQPWRETLHG